MMLAGTAGRTAGADQRFVHDLSDGAHTAAALGAAAEAAVDLSGGARRCRAHGAPHFMVAQHVAGTYDHWEIRRRQVAVECHFR